MKKLITTNNKGMSSIVFAVAFVTILSIVAIGFATIARRDTNEVLDRTLSNQAQLAAESGINYAINKIRTTSMDTNTSCDSFELSTGVQVSCVTWQPADDDKIVLSNIGPNPKNFKLEPASNYNKIKLKWSYDSSFNILNNYSPTGNLPDISGNSVLKIALSRGSDSNTFLMYAVATTNSSAVNDVDLVDGKSLYVECDGSTNVCELEVESLGVISGDWHVALSSIGGKIDSIDVSVLNNNTVVNIDNAQYEIDSNAIANGVTKRLLARIPFEESSWLPANTVTAEKMCKDIKIDGTNNSAASTGGSVCP